MQLLKALAGGVVVALAFRESALAGLTLITTASASAELLVNDATSPPAAGLAVAAVIALAIGAGAAVATALGGQRSAGWLVGVLYALPALVQAHYFQMSALATGFSVVAPLVGALAGAWLAVRVVGRADTV